MNKRDMILGIKKTPDKKFFVAEWNCDVYLPRMSAKYWQDNIDKQMVTLLFDNIHDEDGSNLFYPEHHATLLNQDSAISTRLLKAWTDYQNEEIKPALTVEDAKKN